MAKRTVLALCALPVMFASGGHTQEATPSIDAMCVDQLPRFVERMCGGSGKFNNLVLNMPALCRERGMGDGVSRALQQCGKGNVYTDVWKFRYEANKAVPDSFVQFATSVETAADPASAASSLAYDLADLTFLFCGKDVACHRQFVDAIPPKTLARYRSSSPFCDFLAEGEPYSPQKSDIEFVRDDSLTTGFSRPVCRQMYCQYEDCASEPELSGSDLFTLRPVWDEYYDRVFRGEIKK